MKISSSKSSLLAGIQTVLRALPAKSTMSIMECILFNTTGGKITLTVNNLDLGIETVIDGNIEEAGGHVAIIVDDKDENVEEMFLADDGHEGDISIPAILISQTDGNKIIEYYKRVCKKVLHSLFFCYVLTCCDS